MNKLEIIDRAIGEVQHERKNKLVGVQRKGFRFLCTSNHPVLGNATHIMGGQCGDQEIPRDPE